MKKCIAGAEQCSTFDQEVDFGSANFSVQYEVISGVPVIVNFWSGDTTFSLDLPTTSALILREFIQGHSEIIYQAGDNGGLAADLGIISAATELIFQFDSGAGKFIVFSASDAAGRIPFAMTSEFSTIGFNAISAGSFRVTVTADNEPVCKVVLPEPSKHIKHEVINLQRYYIP